LRAPTRSPSARCSRQEQSGFGREARWALLHRTFTLRQAPLIFVLQFALTVPLAALSWYLFESPILRHKWRWPMPRREHTSSAGLEPAPQMALEPER
jgi:peptidoglycan/LPS O-acetylase OafA/YrhL